MTEGYKSITGLVDEVTPAKTPQFATAEYAKNPAGQLCSVCGTLIAGKPVMLNGNPACANCVSAAGVTTESHSAFVTATVFGIGAALVGLVFYASFTILTHFYFGYVALAVGWMVGKAMITGSKGVGGLRYQVTAAILTYAAISLASVPIIIARLMERGTSVDWAAAAGRLALWGIASPFLQLQRGVSGIIGLVILFVGLRVAVRMTRAR